MKLKCIVLDGFKSYAHRQELDDLDPHFNAITGLNGSGKSNIFDAICFVMGITNLKKVRADDTRDLIYKNGNAGIQRASVSLEFINDDEVTAPPGYSVQDFPEISIARQVICGGKQKFFLNGRIAQQSTIKAFFHSVSMNVDNPHFLVLQGTVHKLLNMKPVEVLSWIEEAAGTRMFDARKRVAEHMIMSKDKKLEEINHTLEGEVATMMEAMGAEQVEYDNYLRISESIDRKRNFKVAYSFWKNLQSIGEANLLIASTEGNVARQRIQLTEELPAKIHCAKQQLDECAGQRQVNFSSEKTAELSETLRTKQQDDHKYKTELQLLEKQRLKQEDTRKKVEIDLGSHEAKLLSFIQNAEKNEKEFEALQDEKKSLENKIEKMKASMQMLKAGLQVGESGMTLLDEQNYIQQELLQLNSSKNRVTSDCESLGNDLLALERRHKTAEANIQKQREHLDILKHNSATLEGEYEKATKGADRNELKNMEEQSRRLRMQRENLTNDRNYSMCDFSYEIPVPNPFPDLRKSVYGRVGSFVSVREPTRHSFALSVATRENLRKVVVRNGETAQFLIEKCRMADRTTFFIMDSIKSAGVINGSRQQMAFDAAAEQTAKNRSTNPQSQECWAVLALELVSFPDNMKIIMDQVFGRFFVCSDLNTARRVALGQTKGRAVTVDGDVVEPGGTLTGGSAGNLLDTLQIFSEKRNELGSLDRIEEELKNIEASRSAAFKKLSCTENQRMAWENAQAELQAQQKIYEDACRENEKYNERKLEISDSRKKCDCLMDELKSKTVDYEKQLEMIKQCLKKSTDPEIKQREFQKKLEGMQIRWKEIIKALENGQFSYEQSVGHREELEGQVEVLNKRLSDVCNDISAITAEKESKVQSAMNLREEINAIEQELHHHEKEIRQEELRKQELSVEYQKLKEEESTLRRSLNQIESEMASAGKVIETMRANNLELAKVYPFLAEDEEKISEGESNEYYFNDTHRTNDTLQSLVEEERKLDALSKKVNKKATFMLEEAKKEFAELTAQRLALLKDKEVILKTIEHVEQKKWHSLDLMVKKVSTGFSNLFGTSLPGASCRLVEQREEERLRGLEVKVSFQGKEKESLTELSGGQRSLLALCLILAILKFRPAPVYILDEIDAALDPSHTENIGKMLQLHFKNAQFLLVSLKDGMFANANVIYEVRHTQGFSEVRRQLNALRKKVSG